jgi:hypothetical protein
LENQTLLSIIEKNMQIEWFFFLVQNYAKIPKINIKR